MNAIRSSAFDAAACASHLAEWLRHAIVRQLRRRGAAVAVSGGIDSAVCLALACHGVGHQNVRAIFLPGIGTSSASRDDARSLCRDFGVELQEHNIVPALEALGCYQRRDAVVAQVFPELPPGTRHKMVIAGDLLGHDRGNLFDLIAEAPDGSLRRARLPLAAYLQLVAATNMKQRVRMTLVHSLAEAHNYAVVGTPNRLECELGFFVRGGDGLADVEPIAHLWKRDVRALSAHLGVPASIRTRPPSTETYSLPQTQEEFFFALPLELLDELLAARLGDEPVASVATRLALTMDQVARIYSDIDQKRRHAMRLRQPALRPEALA